MVAFFCASTYEQPGSRSSHLTANLTTYLETQSKRGVKGLGKCVDITGKGAEDKPDRIRRR
jgi:hypothetical protein